MDIVAHALYGATACSRTGLAGGLKRKDEKPRRSWAADWTVWCAVFFGIFPDLVSLAIPALPYFLAGKPHQFFMNIDSRTIVIYRYAHSLVVASLAVLLLRLVWKPLLLPSLAWPLHICLDASMHGPGIFQTTLFYPLSTWSPNSIRWWEHPNLVLAYWLLLPVIWGTLAVMRRRKAQRKC